jgi:hypothetical protein
MHFVYFVNYSIWLNAIVGEVPVNKIIYATV